MSVRQAMWLAAWAWGLALWACVSGCGVSPEQAADELERSVTVPEEWCGVESEQPKAIEKITIPDDYGNTASPGGCNETGAWPGGVCWVPANLNITWQNTLNSGIVDWNLAQVSALDSTEAWVDAQDYWEITQVASGGNFESRVDLSHPSGYLGLSIKSSYYGIPTAQGEIRLYEFCDAILYKNHIEANQYYQSASTPQRRKYIANLHKHEMGHCVGLMHHLITSNTLMSINYSFPGPWFDSSLEATAAEKQRVEDYAY